MRTILLTVILAGLWACAGDPPKPEPMIVGSDADAHGCKPSTGHAWCQATQRCEQPWMLARQHRFELSQEAFDRFCQNTKPQKH